MKKIIIVVLFLLVLTACIGKTDKPTTEGETQPEVKTYTFNFVANRDVPQGLEELFTDRIKQRIQVYGYEESKVNLTEASNLQVEITDKPGVIFLEEEFKEYMATTPVFEIRKEEDQDKLVLTDEEKQQLEQINNDAKAKAQGLLDQVLADPESFADLARENSDDPGSRDNAGAYVGIKKGVFVPEFDDVIFNKLEVGETYTELVETSFGYHIVKKDAERGEGDEREIDTSHILINKTTEQQALVAKQWLETGLSGLYIDKADAVQQGENNFAFQITFNEEGTQLLSDLTKNNLERRIAIFIDDVSIGISVINEEITDGILLIGGNFTQEGVLNVAQRLSSGTLHSKLSLTE